MLPLISSFARPLASCLLVLLAGSALPALADQAPAEPLAAVSELGRLNGVALACGQTALATRLRDIVVAVAPKSREVGEAYEQAGNAAFLAQGRGQACPDGRSLASSIEAAERRVKAAYPQ